ncbi:alpha/beta fold hydrolase [Nonomuraea cypriaca]|uniref:alpha/beta fold hydrolase n=1 Tax=Nonomuraea cypriaca TaxID=1187855 RepID=UPI001A9C8340|nr:alpha/beta fold hydrolase [Nonomuraea cypriaca]
MIAVPLDWSAPSDAKIELTVVRRKATDPAARVGTLFYNPGGPGVPGALLVRDYASDTFSDELRRRFDIVGIDPRGVGESTPTLQCGLPVHDPAISEFPKSQTEQLISSRIEFGGAYAYAPEIRCLRTSGGDHAFSTISTEGRRYIRPGHTRLIPRIGAGRCRIIRSMAQDAAHPAEDPTSSFP